MRHALLAAAVALSLSAPALAAGARKAARPPASRTEAPRLAILDVAAPAGAFGCGTWASHEAELSAVLRDLLTTELSDRTEGRLRLVGPPGGEPAAADDAAARTRGKLLGARTMLAVQVTRLSCRPSAADAPGATGAPAGRLGKDARTAGKASGKDAKKKSAPSPRPSAGTKLELSGRLAVRVVDVETGAALAALEDENAIVEPAGSAAGGAAALEYDDELATRLFGPVVTRVSAGVVRKLP